MQVIGLGRIYIGKSYTRLLQEANQMFVFSYLRISGAYNLRQFVYILSTQATRFSKVMQCFHWSFAESEDRGINHFLKGLYNSQLCLEEMENGNCSEEKATQKFEVKSQMCKENYIVTWFPIPRSCIIRHCRLLTNTGHGHLLSYCVTWPL